MKILAVVNDCTCPAGAEVELMPDSSVIKDGKPFFVPPIADRWSYSLGVAFLVTRMGKCIGQRFASRYIGGITLCAMPRPTAVTDDMISAGDMLHAFDGAAILGQWLEIPADRRIDVTFNGSRVEFCTDPLEAIEPMVARMSLFGTLKTGDVMIPVSTFVGADFPEDFIASAAINDVECLKFKIK